MPDREDPHGADTVGSGGQESDPTVLSTPDWLGVTIGVYHLVEKIGEGGFGTVYRAEQHEPIRRAVALKIIKLGMDTREVIARFEAERQALAMMDHPHIARVLDAGATETGRPYFVMDLIKGEPITEYCDRHRLGTRARLEMLIDVCLAVQHAHQKGIIHRDLKPSNVLVTLVNDEPVPKVIDFGIAKATSGSLTERAVHTQRRQLIGTPEYMSPEQAEMTGLDVDTRTDVYSLGVVLYELLTGTTPFDGGRLRSASFVEVQRILREEDPPRPSTRVATRASGGGAAADRSGDPAALTRSLRGDLDWIVMKAMEKDRTRRYATAVGIADDLQRHLRNEPVEASPPSAAYRFRKFAARNRFLIGGAAVALAALLVGLAVAAVGFYTAANERDRAVDAERSEVRRRAEAEDARRRAEEALQEARAVTEFLTTMLGAADPGERGRDVTVRAVLDDAASTVDTDFADTPGVEATVRQTLGTTYLALGEYAAAEPHLREAVALREEWLGHEHADTLDAAGTLAALYYYQGRLDESVTLFERVLERQRAVVGDDDLQTIASMNNVAFLHARLGRLEEAETRFVTALAAQRRVAGDDDPATLMMMGNLADLYDELGRHEDAEDLLVEAVETLRQTQGPEHPETLIATNNLAKIYNAAGRFDEAEPLLRATVETQERVLGPEHPQTLNTKNNLAFTLGLTDRTEEAIALHEEVLGARRRVLGDDHPNTLLTMQSLGHQYVNAGRYDDAETLLAEAVETSTRRFGPDHAESGRVRATLGGLRAAQDRHEEAADELRAAYGIFEASGNSSEAAGVARRLAAVYEAWGREEDAARWSERAAPRER